MVAKDHAKTLPCLCPGLSQDVAAQVVLRGHVARFAAELARLTQPSPPPDATHLTRVALRRLRAALEALAPRTDPHLHAKITRRLHRLFAGLGVVRDAEVLAEHSAHLGRLQDLAVRKDKALRKGLKSSDAAHLTKDLDTLFAGKSWRHAAKSARASRKDPIEPLAAQALDHAWTRALKQGPSVLALAPMGRHSLRKRLKSLRYIAEDFAPLWPDAGSGPFLARLRALQDDLGVLNDLDLAAAEGLGGNPDLAQAALSRAQDLWGSLYAQSPWWGAARALPPPMGA